MLKHIKFWVRHHPRIFDPILRIRRVLGYKSPAYTFLNQFSQFQKRPVTFIQVGASDGLHSDPIREFIVRDRWSGVFVEPLPYSFSRLKNNYHYLHRPDLAFVNAALTTSATSNLQFWTFSDSFLSTLSDEEKLDYLQKSSFNPKHLQGYLQAETIAEQAVVPVTAPCVTLAELVDQYFTTPIIDLLVTDLEGYETILIPSIDFHKIQPTAIFYESHNLGSQEKEVSDFLAHNEYDVFQLEGDSCAIRREFLKRWQGQNDWAAQNLADPLR